MCKEGCLLKKENNHLRREYVLYLTHLKGPYNNKVRLYTSLDLYLRSIYYSKEEVSRVLKGRSIIRRPRLV